ncbi:major facilitator superfamily transporter [Xylariales sp. PMI_506]|nr:major facilitator superfamily transporter [Xylariales sp. PMI_506]
MLLTLGIVGYDTSNAANIQAPVYKALGHIDLLSWIGLGFSAAIMATAPLVRAFIGIFNFRHILAGSLVFCAMGAAVSGSATNMSAMIVGRVLIGIGCCGNYLVSVSYVAVLARPFEVPRINGIFGAAYSLGLICGPFIGGGFAENESATWRWAFYINLPLLGICTTSLLIYPSFHIPSGLSIGQQLAKVDWIGAILHIATIFLFYIPVTFSGSVLPWSSGSTIALWVLWFVVFILYVIQQHFSLFVAQEHRIFPVHIVKHRTIPLVYLGTLGVAVAHGIALYYTPLLLAFTHGLQPVGVAVRLLPYIGLFIIFSILAGGVLPRLGRYKLLYLFAGTFTILGSTLISQESINFSYSSLMGYEVLAGLGIGTVFSHPYGVANILLPVTDRSYALLLAMLSQVGGVSLGLAISGCTFQNVGFNNVKDAIEQSGADFVLSDTNIREVLAGVASELIEDSNPVLEALVVGAITDVIKKIFYVAVAGGAFCLLMALLMKREKLDFGMGTNASKQPEEKPGNSV